MPPFALRVITLPKPIPPIVIFVALLTESPRFEKLSTVRLRIPLDDEPETKLIPTAPAPADAPDKTMTGVPAKSESVAPSINTTSLMLGNELCALMVCNPPMRGSVISKIILSLVEPFTVLFAARMASLKEIRPSAPLLAHNAAIELVSPSLASDVVLTTTTL